LAATAKRAIKEAATWMKKKRSSLSLEEVLKNKHPT